MVRISSGLRVGLFFARSFAAIALLHAHNLFEVTRYIASLLLHFVKADRSSGTVAGEATGE